MAILINDVTPYARYTATAGQTLFTVPFEFFNESDLIVLVNDVVLTYSPTPADKTQYSVTGANQEGGGSITLGAPGATLDDDVVIYRAIPIARSANYPETGPMAIASLNTEQAKHIGIMQQLQREADRALLLPLGEAGFELPAAADRASKVLAFDANGDLLAADAATHLAPLGAFGVTLVVNATAADARADLAVNSAAEMAASSGSALLGFIQSGTGAITRTAQDKMRDVISVKDFGAVGDGVTDDTTAIQAALTSLTSGGVLYVPKGIYRCGALTVANDDVTIQMEPGAVLKFNALGAAKAITVNANNFAIDGGALEGPAGGVYVINQFGVYMVGTSTSVRKTGLTITNCEISQFGFYGIYVQFVDNIKVDKNNIHDCGYSGATFLSCNHGSFVGNRVVTIAPGTSGNMYGVSLTHDSTGYSSDPNAGTKAATNPFCWDWYVADNHVEDIDWEGIDTHGGYDLVITGNAVYATKNGIAVTGSSGDALNYAGWSNVVSDNIVDGRNSDGTTSGRENTGIGININGASTVTQSRVTCSGNIVLYKGLGSNANAGAIQAVSATDVVISNNIIDQWQGSAILVTLAGGVVDGNTFGARSSAGDTVGRCISEQGPTTKRLVLTDNVHSPGAGTAALVGFSQTGSATVRPVLCGNNFSAATTGFSLSTTGFCLGSDVAPVITDTGSGTALSVSALNGGNGIVLLSNASPRTIDTFTGAVAGQRILFVNIGAGTQTITRSQAALAGSTSQALATKYALELMWVSSTEPRQVAPMSANG